jgi:hypothetical protein
VASEVDIGNLALSHIGEEAAVTSFDPVDGTIHAEHLARFYPVARDVCLEAHAWKCNRRTEQLTDPLATVPDGWNFAYATPADLLKVLRLYPEGARRDIVTIYEFEVESDDNGQEMILTDIENPFLIYSRKIVDTSKFSPTLTLAISYLLASLLAGPVLKGDSGEAASKYWLQAWQALLGVSTTLDSINQRLNLDPTPSSIAARA